VLELFLSKAIDFPSSSSMMVKVDDEANGKARARKRGRFMSPRTKTFASDKAAGREPTCCRAVAVNIL
jgi:hypothetical protein